MPRECSAPGGCGTPERLPLTPPAELGIALPFSLFHLFCPLHTRESNNNSNNNNKMLIRTYGNTFDKYMYFAPCRPSLLGWGKK